MKNFRISNAVLPIAFIAGFVFSVYSIIQFIDYVFEYFLVWTF